MEPTETILETVQREFREETGLEIVAPQLRGIFTVIVSERETSQQQEWMHFFFLSRQARGEQLAESSEGQLAWHPVDRLAHLPMAEGDRLILREVLRHDKLLVGRFHYAPDYRLLDYVLMETEPTPVAPSSLS